MSATSTIQVLVPIANGSEEIEAVSIIDTLRRASFQVDVASVEKEKQVEMSRKTVLVADVLLEAVKEKSYDIIVLPGGMPGADRLKECETLKQMLLQQKANNKHYAAICAAPAVVFVSHGLINDTTSATCHPSFEKSLPNQTRVEDRIVVDGKCITSRGPGTAIEFALRIIEELAGSNVADTVRQPMLVK